MSTLYTFGDTITSIELKVYTFGGLMNSATKPILSQSAAPKGLRVQGSGFRVQGSGFKGSGYIVSRPFEAICRTPKAPKPLSYATRSQQP